MGIPWDGIGINCFGIGWDGMEICLQLQPAFKV